MKEIIDSTQKKNIILFAQNLVLYQIQLMHRVPEYGIDGEEEMREAVRLAKALYDEVNHPTERKQLDRKLNPEPEETDGL